MIQKIALDMLTQDSVSVKRQRYAVVDGEEYPIGQPHRKAYINSERGRTEIQNELEEPYLSAVMAVWGEQPTVIEEID